MRRLNTNASAIEAGGKTRNGTTLPVGPNNRITEIHSRLRVLRMAILQLKPVEQDDIFMN